MLNFVISIDGPAGSGKSTLAHNLSQRLQFLHVDSGALYRAATWQALNEGIDTSDTQAIESFAKHLQMEFSVSNKKVIFTIEGKMLGNALRSAEVNAHVSPVAAVPAVRQRITEWLREMRELGPLVVEGRDIGSVVFPDATAKFYLETDQVERAKRRHAEEIEKGIAAAGSDQASVLESLRNRDRIDSSRKAAPLKVPEGALIIDNTVSTPEQTLEKALAVLPLEVRNIIG